MKKMIVYTGPNCSSCVTLKTQLSNNNIQYEEMDVTKNMKDVQKYGIRSVPTTLIFDQDGELTNTFVGVKLNEIKQSL